MKKNNFLQILLIAGLLFLGSCKKGDSNAPSVPPVTGNTDVDALINMNAPAGFDYKTDQDVQLDITILAPDNTPIPYIPVEILNKSAELGGKVLFTSLTDDKGKVTGIIKLPSYVTEIVVNPNYLGVIRNAVVSIAAQTISCTLGGSNTFSGNVVPNSPLGGRPAQPTAYTGFKPMSAPYKYMGTYDNMGKPNYLEPVNDVITNAFLANINASLPERMPVTTYHPDYLQNNAETNINLNTVSDVWFTFITEGAGYTNSIAYFTYPTNNPPQTASAIDTLHIVLPNASLNGSGGRLQAGNKVHLGRFSAGTSIGFALIANGWNGSTVGNGYHTVYSIDKLNPEADASLKRHTVLLYDNIQGLFLVGFEDLKRDNASCDNDFNDCLFTISSNPVIAISRTNVKPIDKPVDSDGDGVNDTYDAFPNDPTKAYINYYPGANTYNTLAFEDNWPFIGDFDLNDMLIENRYTLINDRLNRTVEMSSEFVLKAVGATFKNGFGVEFPFAASKVQSVSGSKVTNTDVVSFAANGCEAGQTKAVIIPFDNAFSVMPSTGNGYINTFMSNPFQTPDTTRMKLVFNTPILASEMGVAPFNPFIMINKTRGREVHLAGKTPTQKVDIKYFKTGQDNTIPGQGKYYKTTSNLPYGLSFSETFEYPIEGKTISVAYPRFVAWAQSGGTNYTNWYKDSTTMIKTNVYKK